MIELLQNYTMAQPLVGIIMGSKSDLPIMQKAQDILNTFGIASEMTIASAHRTPKRTEDYCRSARERGLKVLIAGAGGAAHLAGVAKAFTTLPVIAVPINSSNSILGLDSLLAMVQMPSGVPVATVAIDGAKNAGILAAEILATSDDALAQKLEKFKDDMRAKVEQDAQSLE